MILKTVRKRLKWFTILFSFLLPCQVGQKAQACVSGPNWEEQRFLLFNPDLNQNKAWWTFFYNYHLTYLNGAVTSNQDQLEISREWIRALKKDIPVADAEAFIFGSVPDSLQHQNKFYQAVAQNSALREYFIYANKTIGVAGAPIDPWSTETAIDSARQRMMAAIPVGMDLQARTTFPFLKKKYAYQVLKLAFYTNQDRLFNNVYQENFKLTNNPTKIDWWAAHYKAVKTEANFPDSANYLHALVYSHADAKMLVSMQRFFRKDLGATLALARNNEERADILVLKEASNPGRALTGLKQIYKLYPAHKHLPMLITREINKLEDWLGTTKYVEVPSLADTSFSGFWGELSTEKTRMQNWGKDMLYLQQFSKDLKQMTDLQNTNPVLYNLALAYTGLMQNKHQEARKYLDQVPLLNNQVSFQVMILKLILITQEESIAEPGVQEKMGQMFQQLIRDRQGVFESQKMLYSLSAYLKKQYEQKELYHLAGLWDYYQQEKFCYDCIYNTFEYSLIRYFDQRGRVQDIEQLIRLIKKPNKNALEVQLLQPYTNSNYLLDLLSMKYLRKGDLHQALAVLNQIPDSFWQTYINANEYLDHDPFAVNGNRSLDSYNKKEFIQHLLTLEKEALGNSRKRAQNYYLLGNAWLNLNDKSWFMIQYAKGYDAPVEWKRHEINAWIMAKAYYTKALEYEKDPDRQAELTYLLAECCSNFGDKLLKKQAKLYESFRQTQFYKTKNCLTLKDLARL